MHAHRIARPAVSAAPPALVDPRFRALLSSADWSHLPAPIRRRFRLSH